MELEDRDVSLALMLNPIGPGELIVRAEAGLITLDIGLQVCLHLLVLVPLPLPLLLPNYLKIEPIGWVRKESMIAGP